MIKKLMLAAVLACGAPMVAPTVFAPPAFANEQSLADIRQELSVLFVEIQRLKTELSTTGAPAVSGGGTILDRVNAVEGRLQALTSKTEELEFRLSRIVEDGTNRIGDLEFRLVELEGGDLSQLGETTTLGGDLGATAQVAAPSIDTTGLTVAEASDFEAARDALFKGDFREAAEKFEQFTITYPGGPMTQDALYYKGEAHEGLGEMKSAARAYLESYSSAPAGARAAEALYKLGAALGSLGQTTEACVTLAEVEARFPTDIVVADAQQTRLSLGCS